MSLIAGPSDVRRLAHHYEFWLLAFGLSLVVAMSTGSQLLALFALGPLGAVVSLLWRDHKRLVAAHDALLESQELTGAAFELVDAGLIISGPDGVPVSMNAVSRAHIGSDITGTPAHTIALRHVMNADGELLQPNEKPISVALGTGRVSKQRIILEMPEGLATLEVSARRLDRLDGSVIGVVSVAHDISDLLARKEELRRQTANLQAMSTARAALLNQDDARPAVCAAVRSVTGADLVALMVPNEFGELELVACDGAELPPIVVPATTDSLVGTAFLTGRPQIVPDLALASPDRGAVKVLTEALGRPLVAAFFQPVTVGGSPMAVLTVVYTNRIATDQLVLLESLDLLSIDAALALQRDELMRRLAQQATTDSLTGLANRRTFDEEFPREVARAQRTGSPLCVAMLDLDAFKAYNDAHGHAAGDHLLTAVATSWRAVIRESDLLARYGGEEFVLLMPQCAEADATALLDVLRRQMPALATVSAGVAAYLPGEGFGEVLARADTALYEAKALGRDRVVVANAVSNPAPLAEPRPATNRIATRTPRRVPA